PIAGALFKKKAKLNIIPPVKNNQNPTAFKYGKAKSLAPICNGTATFIKPRSIGVAAKKIIIVPCVVNTSSYLSNSNTQNSLLGTGSCNRINKASSPSLKKKRKPNNKYQVPIFRWFVVRK